MSTIDLRSELTSNAERDAGGGPPRAAEAYRRQLAHDCRRQLGDERGPLRIVLSSVSSDSHTWNLVFLQLLLEFMGHQVHNLGACTPDDLIVSTCIETRPDLLVISSVNGHGNIDGERLIRRLRAEARLRDLPVAIGGKLGLFGADNVRYVDRLIRAGFSAVFEASSSSCLFKAPSASHGFFDAFVEQISTKTVQQDIARTP